MGISFPIALLSFRAAAAASIVETDDTGCIDLEELELELDEPWLPPAAEIRVSTSVVAGTFGVDVHVEIGNQAAWETRLAIRRSDCGNVAETVALSLRAGLRTKPPVDLGGWEGASARSFVAVAATAGIEPAAPEIGLRLGRSRATGPMVVEWAIGVAGGFPVRVDPIGAAHLVQGLGLLGVGPGVRLDGALIRPMATTAAGVGLVVGTGIAEPSRTLVPRVMPGFALAVDGGRLHVALSATTSVPRLSYQVHGGVQRSKAGEPGLRVGVEIGIHGAGKVRSSGGTEP